MHRRALAARVSAALRARSRDQQGAQRARRRARRAAGRSLGAGRCAVRAGVSYADMMRNAQMLNLALEREGAKAVWHKYLSASGTRGSRANRAGIARIAAQAGELGFVRTQLSALGNPADYPRDAIWLHTLASLSVCAAAIDDR